MSGIGPGNSIASHWLSDYSMALLVALSCVDTKHTAHLLQSMEREPKLGS